MKKIKYLFIIIIICIVVFLGIEFLINREHEEIENNTTINNTQENNNTSEQNNVNNETSNVQKKEEIQSGEELLEKAEKALTARGWTGASNNLIGLKDNTLYYYNKSTGEFKKVATGVEDIYYKTEFAEEITVKQGNNVEKFEEELTFLAYE